MIEIINFVEESNRIEGITRAATVAEVQATIDFVELKVVTVADLEALVAVIQPGAKLRDQIGLDVRVGNHVPLRGAPERRADLANIVGAALSGTHPWIIHNRYETLHPFMDGNGRSGRALWLWQIINQGHGDSYALKRGFLHSFYYQTLQFGGDR